ncbi:MAG: GAF domain-containing protein [Chloroflexi bacterium]|nr:MAG: GAF domain-containing protein [Chloroflexota bacterium]
MTNTSKNIQAVRIAKESMKDEEKDRAQLLQELQTQRKRAELAEKKVAELQQTLKSTRHQLKHLGEIVTAVLSAQTPGEVWAALTNTAISTMAIDKTAVYLIDQDTNTFRRVFNYRLSTGFIYQLDAQFQDEETRQDFLKRLTPHTTHTHHQTAPLPHPIRTAMSQEGIQAYAILPLIDEGTPIGFWLIFREQATPFTQTDLTVGRVLIRIGTIASQNTLRFVRLVQNLHAEQQLNQIHDLLNLAPDLPTILANVVQMTTRLLNADTGLIGLLIDGTTMTFYPYNLPEGINLRPLPKGSGISWRITETKTTIRTDQYARLPDANYQWVQQGAQAFLGVPLMAYDTCLGVIELYRLTPNRPFTAEDQKLLEAIAKNTGTAIRNRRQLDEARQRAGKLAMALTRQEEQDELKNLFIQNVSHELRTPLGIIYGHAELLESGSLGELDPLQKESVEIIARRALMLTQLVEDLSTLLAAETQEFRRELVNLTYLLVSMLADFQMKADEEGVQLQADIPDDLPPILGDETHLRRVFDNLVTNALKFTPEGGTITLSAWVEGEQIVTEVSDTGPGIPLEYQERIFERFFQIDPKVKKYQPGTGLGLALVKEIVEAHRGTVSVHSIVGEGTTFQVRLPVSPVRSLSGE